MKRKSSDKSEKSIKQTFDLNLQLESGTFKTNSIAKFNLRKPYAIKNPSKVLAFMPGTIKDIFVKIGDEVKEGDNLLILEAMKMNNLIKSPLNGKVTNIHVVGNDKVAKNHLLVEVE